MPGLRSRLRTASLSTQIKPKVSGLSLWLSMSRTISSNIQSLILLLPTLFSAAKPLFGRTMIVKNCSGCSIPTMYWPAAVYRLLFILISELLEGYSRQSWCSIQFHPSRGPPPSESDQIKSIEQHSSRPTRVCIVNRVCMDNIVFC